MHEALILNELISKIEVGQRKRGREESKIKEENEMYEVVNLIGKKEGRQITVTILSINTQITFLIIIRSTPSRFVPVNLYLKSFLRFDLDNTPSNLNIIENGFYLLSKYQEHEKLPQTSDIVSQLFFYCLF